MFNIQKIKKINLILLVFLSGILFVKYLLPNQSYSIAIESIMPRNIGSWDSRGIEISEYLKKGVGSDSEAWRDYFNSSGDKINVWISYYNNQITSTAHNPNTCFNGQGWATEKFEVPIVINGSFPRNISNIVLNKDDQKMIVYYWYIAGGHIAKNEFKKNLYKFYYGLTKNRRDLLFLRFSISLSQDKSINPEKVLKTFVEEFYEEFAKSLPSGFLEDS